MKIRNLIKWILGGSSANSFSHQLQDLRQALVEAKLPSQFKEVYFLGGFSISNNDNKQVEQAYESLISMNFDEFIKAHPFNNETDNIEVFSVVYGDSPNQLYFILNPVELYENPRLIKAILSDKAPVTSFLKQLYPF